MAKSFKDIEYIAHHVESGTFFTIRDKFHDFHTKFGAIKLDNFEKGFQKLDNGTFYIFKPKFSDIHSKIQRGAQIITLKDIASIVAETGVGPDFICMDAGSGSGSLCLFLARLSKKVYTFDIRDDHIEKVKKNIDFVKASNIIIDKRDIYDESLFDDLKDSVDLLTLDVPEPWRAIKTALKCVKKGGFIVSYVPCITQVMNFCEALKDFEELVFLKSVENLERDWIVDGRKVRPKSQGHNHTAFLTFVRRV